jgi:hypothetical protein
LKALFISTVYPLSSSFLGSESSYHEKSIVFSSHAENNSKSVTGFRLSVVVLF